MRWQLTALRSPASRQNSLNTIDLLAILPFYVERLAKSGGVESTQFLRTLRLIRVFRIFKISRLQLIVEAALSSLAPLGMALFITLIYVVILGSAMYYIERGRYDAFSRVYVNEDNTPTYVLAAALRAAHTPEVDDDCSL